VTGSSTADGHRSTGPLRVVRATGWVVAALAVAFGGAGLASSLDQQPGSSARTELTWAADRAIEPSLDAAVEDLRAISADVDRLGVLGREALVALLRSRTGLLGARVTAGTALIPDIEQAGADLRASLAGLPGAGPDEGMYLSAGVIARRNMIDEALAATDGLARAWSGLASAAAIASQVTAVLQAHDDAVVAAAAAGRQQRYVAALEQMDRADAFMAEALRIRDRLRNTVDVTSLSEWLDRGQDYDVALRRLYRALRDSAGRVTAAVRKAFKAEQAARDRLPSTTGGLVIAMNDFAQAGANDAVIAIEEARGLLDLALVELDQVPVSPDPSAGPGSPKPSG
jgi:hypothetical protein